VIFANYDPPLYFVTFCTMYRQRILACEAVDASLREFGGRGASEGRAASGRYVIMPDHVHLFVRGGQRFNLGLWVRALKRTLANAIKASGTQNVVAPVSGAEPHDIGSPGTGECAPGTGECAPGTGATTSSIWQPGFFDHVMRNSESYASKWQYVRENPVRAGLVERSEDWLYQGEIVLIDRV